MLTPKCLIKKHLGVKVGQLFGVSTFAFEFWRNLKEKRVTLSLNFLTILFSPKVYMDTKVGQMSRNHQKVGQMSKGNYRMGAKVQGLKSSGIKSEPSQQQIQETANEYNKFK